VDQQIGFGHFFQRRAEGGNQLRGQLLNKAYCICEQDLMTAG
jgi:hypothetical protein